MNIYKEIECALSDFIDVCILAKTQIELSDIEMIHLDAPHSPTSIAKGKMAAYIFSFNDEILKIGIVGAKSNARFLSQHYNPNSSQSNLAKSILNDNQFPARISDSEIKDWIKNNCCRINILISEDKGMHLIRLLEAFLHLRFAPRYER